MTCPLASLTVAVIVERAARQQSSDGVAVNQSSRPPRRRSAILTAPVVPVVTPPETAMIVAVPDCVPALNVTITRPPESVSASIGRIVPSDVVKETSVPLFGGVPAGSITCAMMLVVPFSGSV